MKEANQDGVKAYHAWIRDYVEQHIKVNNFMQKIPENLCINSLDTVIVLLGGVSYKSKSYNKKKYRISHK